MTQESPGFAPVFTNFIPPQMAELSRKHLETLAAVQKEFLAALNKANRSWVAYLNEEAALTSNFTNKMIETRSIPNAAAAYQEWVAQQLELVSKQARDAVDEIQGFTKACSNILVNGERSAIT